MFVFSILEVDLGQFGVQNRFLRVKLCILASGNVSRSISGSKGLIRGPEKKGFYFFGGDVFPLFGMFLGFRSRGCRNRSGRCFRANSDQVSPQTGPRRPKYEPKKFYKTLENLNEY